MKSTQQGGLNLYLYIYAGYHEIRIYWMVDVGLSETDMNTYLGLIVRDEITKAVEQKEHWIYYQYLKPKYDDTNGELVYSGISPIRQELGKSIGDCDLTSTIFSISKSMNLGNVSFEQEDLNQVGNQIMIDIGKILFMKRLLYIPKERIGSYIKSNLSNGDEST